jgi:hypothetical protein
VIGLKAVPGTAGVGVLGALEPDGHGEHRLVLCYPREAPPWFRLVIVSTQLCRILLAPERSEIAGRASAPDQAAALPREALYAGTVLAARWERHWEVSNDPQEDAAAAAATIDAHLMPLMQMWSALAQMSDGLEADAASLAVDRVLAPAPWAVELDQPTTDPDRLHWLRLCLLTDLYAAARRLSLWISDDVRREVAVRVRRAGLRGPLERAGVAQVCLDLAVGLSHARPPSRPRPTEPDVPGATSRQAAEHLIGRAWLLRQSPGAADAVSALRADLLHRQLAAAVS